MEKISLEEMITKEKEETPKCYCGKEMIFDMIKGKYMCPECESPTRFSDDRRLVRADIEKLWQLPQKSLIAVIQLRECKYNYLYNDWSQAAKGDRKTEFFYNRMKDKEKELDEIKYKGVKKVINEERLSLIKKVKHLESKISDLQSEITGLKHKIGLNNL